MQVYHKKIPNVRKMVLTKGSSTCQRQRKTLTKQRSSKYIVQKPPELQGKEQSSQLCLGISLAFSQEQVEQAQRPVRGGSPQVTHTTRVYKQQNTVSLRPPLELRPRDATLCGIKQNSVHLNSP